MLCPLKLLDWKMSGENGQNDIRNDCIQHGSHGGQITNEGTQMITLTNSELLNALHETALRVSYFNAGEGACYRAETNARHAAKSEWDNLVIEAKNRGIYNADDFKNYLL